MFLIEACCFAFCKLKSSPIEELGEGTHNFLNWQKTDHYSIPTFKRITFDFLNARDAFRNLKVMKISFIDIVPSL